MRYVEIKENQVINTIEADEEFISNIVGLYVRSDTAEVGDYWNGNSFNKGNLILNPPASVTMRQARLALLNAGKLSIVNTAIANMPGTQGEAARIEWEFSNEVQRKQPLVLALGAMLGMSEAQLDQLFITAESL